MNFKIRCPAKVNLFLAVGPKDSLGYHPLRTIFQTVDLCDTLDISTNAQYTEIVCEWADLPHENTLTKTFRLLQEVVKLPPLRIGLTKRIPAESGLGGGSSDAAGLIKAAMRLAPNIPKAELLSIASAVGADVPFFLVGGRAKAEGYGEKLTPLPDGSSEWLTIVRPEVGCGTAESYEKLDELRYAWREFPAGDELYNDFERVAPSECTHLIERLQVYGARDSGLTGSGSAVFGRFTSEESAQFAKAAIRGEGYAHCWAVRTLDRAELDA